MSEPGQVTGATLGGKRVLFHIGRTLASIFFHTYIRIKTYGKENFPESGPFLFAVNHASALDPPMAGVVIPGESYFLARQTLFQGLGRWLLPRLGAFPVRRGEPDRRAIRFAVKALNQGTPLIMFPEGTRSTDGRVKALHGGAAMIALRAQVPIVPGYLAGTHRLMPRGASVPRPGRAAAFIGPPIPIEALNPHASSRERHDELIGILHEALLRLESEAGRRFPEFSG
jgi:1-acyl-sn-glycerol-3-phosphate acyltransferase